jgi:hypothetical protein
VSRSKSVPARRSELSSLIRREIEVLALTWFSHGFSLWPLYFAMTLATTDVLGSAVVLVALNPRRRLAERRGRLTLALIEEGTASSAAGAHTSSGWPGILSRWRGTKKGKATIFPSKSRNTYCHSGMTPTRLVLKAALHVANRIAFPALSWWFCCRLLRDVESRCSFMRLHQPTYVYTGSEMASAYQSGEQLTL